MPNIICYFTNNNEACPLERELAARDLAFLARLFAGRNRQRQFRSQHVHWDRILFAKVGDTIAGQVCFFLNGKGPYRQRLADFTKAFGWWRGLYAGTLCQLIALKFKRKDAYIYFVYVRPEFRGQGVASKLIDTVKQHLIDAGVRTFAVDIRGMNQASQKLMAKAAATQLDMAPEKRSIWQVIFKHLIAHRGKVKHD